MSIKLNLKSLTKTQLANHLKKLKSARKNKGVVNRPKPSYLNIKGTRGQIKSAPAQPSSANKSNSKMDTNMQMYRNYIQRMVNTGFLDPKEATFRNDVVKNMKTLRSEKPNITRMNNAEWFVNDLVAKSRKTPLLAGAAVVSRNTKTLGRSNAVKITTMPPMSKTRQLLLQRRKALAQKKGGRSRVSTIASKSRIKPMVTANSSSSNNVMKSNGSNREFNMNKSNKSESNSNKNAASGYKSDKSTKSSASSTNKSSSNSNNKVSLGSRKSYKSLLHPTSNHISNSNSSKKASSASSNNNRTSSSSNNNNNKASVVSRKSVVPKKSSTGFRLPAFNMVSSNNSNKNSFNNMFMKNTSILRK